MTTRIIEGKHSRGKRQKKCWMDKEKNVGRVTDALKARKDQEEWKALITYTKVQGKGCIDL